MRKLFYIAAALLCVTACSKDEIEINSDSGNYAFKKGQIVTISASSDLSGDTKVAGTDNGTNINFTWETGDKILVKIGEESAEFILKTGAGSNSATFEGTMPASGNTFDMQYPTTIPDLSTQAYVDSTHLPKDKMLFTATGCTLGSAAELQPQYAVLQLKLQGQYFTSEHYFKEINVTFSINELDEYTEKHNYKLSIPENAVVVPYTLAAGYATFYFVVNPGTYKIQVVTELWDDSSSTLKKVVTSSDKTLTAGECLNMKGANITNCFAAGTCITMADGSLKKVENIVEGDEVMTFDHEAGCVSSQMVCLTYKGEDNVTPLNLTFASGRKLSIVGTHDILCKDILKYIRINSANVKSYVGKQFYNVESGTWDELVGYEMGAEPVEYYCIYSAYHLNCIAEGMLTCPDDVDFLLNIYELDSNLKADQDRLNADIHKYGLRNLAQDYPEYMQFAGLWEQLQFKYINIALGKSLVTKDQLNDMRAYWDNK